MADITSSRGSEKIVNLMLVQPKQDKGSWYKRPALSLTLPYDMIC
ncbi:hypothetical protein [Streptococcus macacae]|uniref:Uncharacterized protein n=1 Tax=Streptococcus macacae NCTC 11558 TaxID=764298 RepID=G5JY34_9STRE|nr:hypothetical protein [Streptococcus macacae]EHJ53048.1 hypothetical protein STRMA_0081 [Streptococcus macacae NCTC 11558]